MKTLEFLKEAKAIRAGQHKGYTMGSDRIYNFEHFCYTFAKVNPVEALEIAAEIENNISKASEESGMTEHGCGIAASILKKNAN